MEKIRSYIKKAVLQDVMCTENGVWRVYKIFD